MDELIPNLNQSHRDFVEDQVRWPERNAGVGWDVCEAAYFVLDFLRPFVSRQKDKEKSDTFNGDRAVMSYQVKISVQ